MTPDPDAVRAMMEGVKQMIALTDELCTAVDCEAEDIGGQRKPITILRELGQSAEKANAARDLVPALAADLAATRAALAEAQGEVERLRVGLQQIVHEFGMTPNGHRADVIARAALKGPTP